MYPKVLVIIATMMTLQACRHPLAIQGEGDIVDLNASDFGCTLEQFQALVFRLTVTDDDGATGSDDTSVTVTVDNSAVVDLYNATCSACHRSGRFSAPRALTDDWNSRVGKGIDALVSSVTNGRGFMPAGGQCSSCTPEDYAALISYMSRTEF